VWGIIRDLRGWLLGAAAAYAAYTATYIVVQKNYPTYIIKFPFRPWPAPKRQNGPPTGGPGPGPGPGPNAQGHKHGSGPTLVDHGDDVRSGRLWLEVVRGPLQGQRIPVDKKDFQIGADPSNDLVITSDDYLSGKHAAVQASKGGWILIDKRSRNGTFVDGQKLPGEPGQVLRPGQSIRIGAFEFRVAFEYPRRQNLDSATLPP